jgi:hypothetical protein
MAWLWLVIIGQLVGALVGTFILNLIWKLMHPGQGWFGKTE